MSLSNNYFHYWVDSKKDEEIKKFQECIDSYIYFKKDAFNKTNKLIKKKPEFNAPKLLKIVLKNVLIHIFILRKMLFIKQIN